MRRIERRAEKRKKKEKKMERTKTIAILIGLVVLLSISIASVFANSAPTYPIEEDYLITPDGKAIPKINPWNGNATSSKDEWRYILALESEGCRTAQECISFWENTKKKIEAKRSEASESADSNAFPFVPLAIGIVAISAGTSAAYLKKKRG